MYILLREICVNYNGIAPTQPTSHTEIWHCDSELRWWHCNKSTFLAVLHMSSDLHLLFSLRTSGSAIERVPCKHRKEEKADISHLLMLTQMGKTILMYCWACCCIGIYIRYFVVYHFSFRTALEFDAMMQGGHVF